MLASMNDYYPSFEEMARRLEGRGHRCGECLIWDGKSRVAGGHAQIRVGGRHGRSLLVHRMAFEVAHGRRIPPRGRVIQSCGKPDCFEPSHLLEVFTDLALVRYPELPERWGDDDYPSLLRIAAKLKGRGAWSGDCLLWDRSLDPSGYGVASFSVGGEQHMHRVHRLAFELKHQRRIKPGLVINHLCEVKDCFNADHLEEVTQAENLKYDLKRDWSDRILQFA